MNSSLLTYLLHLGDNALVLGHRNSEWTGHGPILEQDIALSNIALDLIGQARNFYQLAATIKNDGSTEDHFAYLRNADQFLNCLIVEQENGHWGKTILRQFLYSSAALLIFEKLQQCSVAALAAIAEKSLKEVLYHVRWSGEWVIRLGQGTAESNEKMQAAIDEIWMYTEELVTPETYEREFVGDWNDIADKWKANTKIMIDKAGISVPENCIFQEGGKKGRHTEHLESLLNEMQMMQRTYPGMEW